MTIIVYIGLATVVQPQVSDLAHIVELISGWKFNLSFGFSLLHI